MMFARFVPGNRADRTVARPVPGSSQRSGSQRAAARRRRGAGGGQEAADRGRPIRSSSLRGSAVWGSVAAVVGGVGLVWPNVTHIWNYKVPVFLDHSAIGALDTLKSRSSPRDFVVTWWDFGSAVWFYSGCRSLNSPATNESRDNYLISQILSTDSQRQAVQLSRITVENYLKRKLRYRSAVEKILLGDTGGHPDPRRLLADAAREDGVLPEKTREVFLFLPRELLDMFAAIRSFSQRDLLTGREEPPATYRVLRGVHNAGDRLVVGGGLVLDLAERKATLEGKAFSLKAFHATGRAGGEQLVSESWEFDPRGLYQLTFLQDLQLFLLTDQVAFDSTLVQLFAFERYDADLLEPVVLGPTAKLFRIKR
jgi:hypothetical protein